MDDIPDDIVIHVFDYLEPEDVKNCVLVSRKWKLLLSSKKKYWTWAKLKADSEVLNQIVDSERFKLVDSLEFWIKQDGELFKETMAEFFSKLAACEAYFGKQLSLIHCAREQSQIMLQVLPEDFGSAVAQLSGFITYSEATNRCWISKDQLNCMFKCIAEKEQLPLGTLELPYICLDEVDPETLGRAVNRLESVNLHYCSMVSENATPMFTILAETVEPSLHTLHVGRNKLVDVAADILARAVCKLTSVNLNEALRSEQVTAIFQQIDNTANLRLQTLSLEFNSARNVPDETFARAVCKLGDVDLRETSLRPEQVTALMTMIDQMDNLLLHTLDISDEDASKVPAQIISSSACKLKEVNLRATKMTVEQLRGLLSMIVETDWPKLRLSTVTIDEDLLEERDRDLICQAKRKVKIKGLFRLI